MGSEILFDIKKMDKTFKKGKEVILNICKGDEQKQFLEILNKKLQYKEYPDIIGLKTQVADKMIEENCYCF